MLNLPNKITGPWNLADLNDGKIGTPAHGLTVFSCFHCGGGSTMGYKLAGFNVLGGVEIDPEMMDIYRRNFNPKHSYLMDIKDFKYMDLPKELYNLDVLDGSPPCSSFSMAGARERLWGKEKKFREGQSEQVLDDLFFHFIDVAERMRPKMVIAENVKGLIMGNAKGYVKQIFRRLGEAGYEVQLFVLCSSRMGVPQRRERIFFIARRKDLGIPRLNLKFDEEEIPLIKALRDLPDDETPMYADSMMKRWLAAPVGGYSKTKDGNTFGFVYRSDPTKPCSTITASPRAYHWSVCRRFNQAEVTRIQSFPDDFNYIKSGTEHANYVCGMSVPPFMMQRVSLEVAKSLLSLPRS